MKITFLTKTDSWVKNGIVLAPLVFSGAFLDAGHASHAFLAVLLFCVALSATYVINDMHDIERDRHHPKKSKTRPLAVGIVSVPAAPILLACLYGVLAHIPCGLVERALFKAFARWRRLFWQGGLHTIEASRGRCAQVHGTQFAGLDLAYVVEDASLGTGGSSISYVLG